MKCLLVFLLLVLTTLHACVQDAGINVADPLCDCVCVPNYMKDNEAKCVDFFCERVGRAVPNCFDNLTFEQMDALYLRAAIDCGCPVE